jgi:hypothetical protein
MNADLNRVQNSIGDVVLNFVRNNRCFNAEALRNDVEAEVGHVAPNSPYRIMYELKRQGKINYRVLSRSRSEYEILEA